MSEYIITSEQLNWFLEHMIETVAIPAKIAHLKPIVHCRDCERFFKSDTDFFPLDWCEYLNTYIDNPDGFLCVRGERRHDG